MKNASFLGRVALCLGCGLAPALALAGTPDAAWGPAKALGIELLALAPLAALAYWLRSRKGKSAATELSQSNTLRCGKPKPLGLGASAQIVECDGARFMLVHAKNGTIQVASLPAREPENFSDSSKHESPSACEQSNA